MQSITSQLQKIQLTDVPIIPLWYNGEWSQVNNSTLDELAGPRKTYPGPARHLERLLARWKQIYMLTNIKAVPKK